LALQLRPHVRHDLPGRHPGRYDDRSARRIRPCRRAGLGRGPFSYFDGVLADGATLKLCERRYPGSAHHWGFAIYRASHDDYQESIFPTGQTRRHCEDALDTACGLYLGDRTTWT
jgi:hypothetical protein